MFEKILIVYSEKLTEKHLKTVEKVKALVSDRKFSVVRADKLQESDFDNIELVITIGGDGAFIRAANFIKNQLILGINSEPEYSEGALKSLMENELEILKDILAGKFRLIKRERAEVKRNGIKIPHLAMEVYVGSFSQFHTSRYVLKFKNQEEEQRSSGVLITTGSGSTAWYKSSGGLPFSFSEKKLKFIVREPYFGERLFKPKILHGEILQGEKIEFKSTRYKGGVVALDANITQDFNTGDVVEIYLSDCPLNVIVKEK